MIKKYHPTQYKYDNVKEKSMNFLQKTKLSIFLLYSSIQTFFKNISVKLAKVLGKWEK
jgi:hypothetical protein